MEGLGETQAVGEAAVSMVSAERKEVDVREPRGDHLSFLGR